VAVGAAVQGICAVVGARFLDEVDCRAHPLTIEAFAPHRQIDLREIRVSQPRIVSSEASGKLLECLRDHLVLSAVIKGI